ncbi:MAG: type VI secretion system tip protein TssI/VgrG [Polyangiaceae bacterium]
MRVAELTVQSTTFDVNRVAGRLSVSRPYLLAIDVTTEADPPSITDLLGQPYELLIRDTHERSMTITGFVVAVERKARGAIGASHYELQLGSPVTPLQLGRDSRVFQEMTAVKAIEDVLARGGVTDVEWRVTGNYAERPYIAQYRESDWDFIERLTQEEGIVHWFEHEDGPTKLIFCDDTTQAADLDEGAELLYREAVGLGAASDAVYGVRQRAAVVHDAVRLRDYNFETPAVELDEKVGDGPLELYDFPGRFAIADQGKQLAQMRLEASRAQRLVTSGDVSTTRLRVGRVVEISGHPIEALNGRLFVTGVDLRATEAHGGEADSDGLTMTFDAIPVDTPFRAKRRLPVTRDPGGPETGIVVGPPGEEIYPDDAGRIRVQFYWDREGQRDDKASTWMRVGQFPLGGSMIIPRIGWDVMVHHHEGDIDAPFVSGHLYDGQHSVPYPLPANKTRTAFQTATTPGGGSVNEIRFEDKKGSEEIFMNASKDMNVVVGDNKMEKIGVDFTETIGANLSVTIGSNMQEGIVVDQDVTIGANESLTVSGSRAVSVTGSETTTIGGSRTVTVTKGSTTQAKAGRTVTVGGSMIGASALSVSRMALGSFSATIGGSLIRVAAAGLSDLTGGAAAETVGGAKIAAGAAGCSVSVKGALAETVGGAYAITAGSNVGESSTGALAITVGGAMLANAPSVELEATSEISFRVGGASLTIKPSSVEVKAPTIFAPGAAIKKKASKIEHN